MSDSCGNAGWPTHAIGEHQRCRECRAYRKGREAGRVDGLEGEVDMFASAKRDGVDVHPYVFRKLSELIKKKRTS